MSLQNPDLVGNEKFGIAGNVSYWDQNAALGFSTMGVVGRNIFGSGERLAISGAVGVSVAEQSFGGHGSETTVGGRAGAQLTW
jgi:trimeric autotransporter adhesin